MTLHEAIDTLVRDPQAFMRSEVLCIAGKTTASAGPALFELRKTSGAIWSAVYVTHDVAAGVKPDRFVAWYVPMQQIGNFSVNWLPTPEQSPIDLMLTSQLSGCMFGMGESGGRTCVAHVQPDQNAYKNTSVSPGMKHAYRQNDLGSAFMHKDLIPIAAADFDYDRGEKAAVVGKRTPDGEWKMYIQRFDMLAEQVTGLKTV
ncbi:MAG: hypothetical protein SFV54_12730 [Bryobacteraceae bacterium]|nr:hypothetical protein [Bryobacteraceae bacterium]